MNVKQCMCNDVKTVQPNTTLCDCAKLMCDCNIGCVPVCDESNNVVGLITDRDVILRAIACGKDCKTVPVSEIMTCKVCTCDSDADIKQAQKIMSDNAVRRLPVIENNKIIGMLTLGDLSKAEFVKTEEVGNTFENICNCENKNCE